MSDKPLSEMTEEEIIVELMAIRDRRASRSAARSASRNAPKRQPKVEDVSGMGGLDDLFANDDDDLTSE